ncbi:ABC transporter substrate-binding protein, partial [Clostridioides difficile]|nr:ABC transporter substrate-binding protein [Clostridioides difficile]
MRLKRVLAMVLAAGMVCASLTACGGSKTTESSAA